MIGINSRATCGKLLRSAVMILLALVIAGSAAQLQNETVTIGAGNYYTIPITGVKTLDALKVDIQVINGGQVDILLMKAQDYTDYQKAILMGGTFDFYPEASSLAVQNKAYGFTFPETTDYYLIIDNSDNPHGGASPTKAVEVHTRIRTSNYTPVESHPSTAGFGAALALLAIAVLALLRR